jgi:hypothetical protein
MHTPTSDADSESALDAGEDVVIANASPENRAMHDRRHE